MESGHRFGITFGEQRREQRADVTALRHVAVVSKLGHQLPERRGHDPAGYATAVGRPGETEAGQGGDDEVERVGRIATVRPGIGQRPDDVEELAHRAGPAMHHDHRQCARLWRAHVHEVQAHTVDGRDGLRPVVEPLLGSPPVIVAGPPLAQLSQVGHRRPVVPPAAGKLVAPSRAGQPRAEVVDFVVRDGDGERYHRRSHPDRRVGVVVEHRHAELGERRGVDVRRLPDIEVA